MLASNRVECCPEPFQMQAATASGDVCSRLENEPILSSTYELITLASALVEVTGSRILKPTVQAVYSEDSKKAHRQGWAFLFFLFRKKLIRDNLFNRPRTFFREGI
jgi:hypothetical protein